MAVPLFQLEVGRYCAVSARHITLGDIALLQDRVFIQTHQKWTSEDEWYGAFVIVSEPVPTSELQAAGYSSEFIAILQAALDRFCDWVEFDVEGPLVSPWPVLWKDFA